MEIMMRSPKSYKDQQVKYEIIEKKKRGEEKKARFVRHMMRDMETERLRRQITREEEDMKAWNE